MKKIIKNKNYRKICAVITARTSYTKMKSILIELKKNKKNKLYIVCAGSSVSNNYGNLEKQIKRDNLSIYRKLNTLLDDKGLNSSTKSVGLGILLFSDVFLEINPDLVIVMADRYEIIAPAIASSYQNFPLAHVQGGEITGNIDEKVRHAVTKLSDLHFPATKKAYDNICRMGEDKKSIFFTGCPSIDIASKIKKIKNFKFDISKKYKGVGDKFIYKPKTYLIVMFHPDTNSIDKVKYYTTNLLRVIQKLKYNVYWFWPNADPGTNIISKVIREKREINNISKIHFIKNMEPEDFLILLNNAKGIIGNSSSGIRESSFLGVPSVNIGNRQNRRERHNNVLDIRDIKDANIKAIQSHFSKIFKSSKLYGNGNAGKKIASIINNFQFSSDKFLNYK